MLSHTMVSDKVMWWFECVQPPKKWPLAAQLKFNSCFM